MTNLEAAIGYTKKLNWPVIPSDKNKRPLLKEWKKYQTKKPTIEEIRKWWTKWPYANISLITGKISGICIIDVDEEKGFMELQKYIPDTMIMPTVSTPSGGKHFYFKYPEIELGNNQKIIPGCDFKTDGGLILLPPSKAISKQNKKLGQYKWELKYNKNILPQLPKAYCDAIKEASNKFNNAIIARDYFFTKGTRDNDLFHVANCLIRGGMAKNMIASTVKKLAMSCDPPFPENEALEKVKSALNRNEDKTNTMVQDVKEYIENSVGSFMISDVQKALCITTRNDQKNLSKILINLVKKEELERCGSKNGCYRKVENICETINWQEAKLDTFPIEMPLKLNSLVDIMPKNIIIVSGSQDAGKTAFLLNVAALNLDKHSGNIHYFSSEMSDSELKLRLSNFENIDYNLWNGCKFWERAYGFKDIIQPNAINIIDYLEITDNFFKIAEILKDIFIKLEKGIAIIAIQQKRGEDMGRGGSFSLEKPRLYLSINPNPLYGGQIIKIVKAKNWANHYQNPNGMVKEFNIVKGCNIIERTEWEYRKEK